MIYPLGSHIRQYLSQNKPCDASRAPAAFDHAMGEAVWEVLAKNTVWKKGFDDCMTTRNKTLSIPWHIKYPVKDNLSAAKPVIVDVGGSQGMDLERFVESFPDLDCDLILQDLPETLEGIPGPLHPRIQLMAHDFFKLQVVKGQFYSLNERTSSSSQTRGGYLPPQIGSSRLE